MQLGYEKLVEINFINRNLSFLYNSGCDFSAVLAARVINIIDFSNPSMTNHKKIESQKLSMTVSFRERFSAFNFNSKAFYSGRFFAMAKNEEKPCNWVLFSGLGNSRTMCSSTWISAIAFYRDDFAEKQFQFILCNTSGLFVSKKCQFGNNLYLLCVYVIDE